jgi:Raf kinase inhibitor-like YbhB/YbcL family protein
MPVAPMSLRVSSTAFSEGQTIPRNYTCDGQNISPPLEWSGAPGGAKSLTLICDDPDAPGGTFTHWVLYDMAPDTSGLTEGSSGRGKEGINSFGTAGYGGPCPPVGHGPHRYFFHLYALDVDSLGREGSSRKDVEMAMKNHVLAEGHLMGRYERKRQ